VTTKTGDDGSTGMADGSRLSKSSCLVSALGEIDELNSWIGLLASSSQLKQEVELLRKIQNDLFNIGGCLAMRSNIGLNKKKIEWLEEKINDLNKELPSLDNFILPGGHKDSSKAQIIRAVCRRSERSLVMASETELINKNCIIYINRLSDFLFVLARKINIDSGEEEILWDQP
jgi:cob(I)alamin adenosyltransferase|tara:strand:- start:789 stop:1310 length:522 start_codon:yes stop_codon:yes gene_type:complete